MKNPMSWCHREPRLEDILSDSIVKAMMQADGINPTELEAMLRRIGRLRAVRWDEPRPRAPA